MSTHKQYQELISRLLDEDTTITAEENAALQAHLSECPDCSAMYQAFSAMSGFVGGELEEPPEELRENVMAEIRREEIRRKNRRSIGWTGFVAAAAVLALVIGFSPRILGQNPDSIAASVEPAGGSVYAAAAENYAEPRTIPTAEEEDYAAEYGADYDTENAPAAAAPESYEDEEDYGVTWEGENPYEVDAAPEESFYDENAEEKLSMDSLLSCLSGIETDLDFNALQLTPVYLVDTDAGVLQIYRYNNRLYFTDPLSGIPCAAGCSEAALLRFLQE